MQIKSHSYSNNITNQKVAILGPFPPPLGGVAVHVQRVMDKLKKQNNSVRHFETVVEYRYRYFFAYALQLAWFLITYRPSRVYFHTLYLSNGLQELRLLVFFKGLLNFKLTLIEHDCRYMYKQSVQYKNRLNICMQSVDELICIGNITEQSYRDNNSMFPKNYTCESAFLPPDLTRAKEIEAKYPADLEWFLANQSQTMLANAFQLSLIDGKDLYGFSMCIEAMHMIKDVYPNINLILVLGQIGDANYFVYLQKLIDMYALKSRVYFLIGQKELWPLFKKVDIFVRPTLSDGASVSIEEALFFNVPVIASDACLRPQGVIPFKTGNAEDFTEKLLMVLGGINNEKTISRYRPVAKSHQHGEAL